MSSIKIDVMAGLLYWTALHCTNVPNKASVFHLNHNVNLVWLQEKSGNDKREQDSPSGDHE